MPGDLFCFNLLTVFHLSSVVISKSKSFKYLFIKLIHIMQIFDKVLSKISDVC